MGTFLSDLRLRFRQGNLLNKLLYINIGVFVVVRLTVVVLTLLGMDGAFLLRYLQLSSWPGEVLVRPWTLLTYMVLHYDFFHILFNLLWFYWFGQLFLLRFSERQLGGLYVLGGLGGALLYLLSYNLLPYFTAIAHSSYLMGASASILAVVVAVAVSNPNEEMSLLFIGRVKLKWLAVVTILIDVLSVTSENAGGSIAHLGGAMVGYLFALQQQRGRDLTLWVNRMIDGIVDRFKPRPKIKVTSRKAETDYEFNARKHQDEEVLNAILEKIKRTGYAGLSSEDKKKLFEAGKR